MSRLQIRSTYIYVSQVSYVGLRTSGAFYLLAMGDAEAPEATRLLEETKPSSKGEGLAELCGMAAMRSVPWTKGHGGGVHTEPRIPL